MSAPAPLPAEAPAPDRPSVLSLARRLGASDRLRRRRFELLPLTGPGAAFAEVQGRGPGESTAPAALATSSAPSPPSGSSSPSWWRSSPPGATGW